MRTDSHRETMTTARCPALPMRTTRSSLLSLALTAVVTAAFASGCASHARGESRAVSAAAEQQASGSQSETASSAASSSTATVARNVLTRALIEETVTAGLGAFLSRVSVAPVLDGRRFVGFRLESAEDLELWRSAGADLRLGDVIQRINGQSIERPEQAMWAFNQLRIAQGIEVVGLRGSAPFRVYSPIVDGAANSAVRTQ